MLADSTAVLGASDHDLGNNIEAPTVLQVCSPQSGLGKCPAPLYNHILSIL